MKQAHSIGVTGYLFTLILGILAYTSYLRYQEQPHYIAVYPQKNWQSSAFDNQTVNYQTASNTQATPKIQENLLLRFETNAIDLSQAEYQRFLQTLTRIKDQPVQLRIFFSSHRLNASENEVRHQQRRVQRIAQTAFRYTRRIMMQASKTVQDNHILIEILPKQAHLSPVTESD